MGGNKPAKTGAQTLQYPDVCKLLHCNLSRSREQNYKESTVLGLPACTYIQQVVKKRNISSQTQSHFWNIAAEAYCIFFKI